MLEVKNIDLAGAPVWEQYVQDKPGSGPYLSFAWGQAVEKSYGHKTHYLAVFSNGQISGVLPLILVSSPLPWCRGGLVSLPFCDYGGLLVDDGESASALLDHALFLAGQLGVGLEVRAPVGIARFEQDPCFGQATDKCRMVLKLPASSALLWDGFKSKLRSQVKRASKEGLVCRLGHSELLGHFYPIFSQNMRDLGSPVHSKKWLYSVVGEYGEGAKVAIVYKEDIPVAGGIVLAHGRLLTIPWASTLRAFNRLSPNMLLYWTFLEYACDNGFEFFDFGRSTPNEGTYAFKRQWGAQPEPLHWYRLGFRPEKGNKDGTGKARSMLEHAWQRLPLVAANIMGPAIRKYIDR